MRYHTLLKAFIITLIISYSAFEDCEGYESHSDSAAYFYNHFLYSNCITYIQNSVKDGSQIDLNTKLILVRSYIQNHQLDEAITVLSQIKSFLPELNPKDRFEYYLLLAEATAILGNKQITIKSLNEAKK